MPDARLLLTRADAQSRDFAAQIKARFGQDFGVVISPVLRIEHRPLSVDPAGYDGWVFTSRNAVAAFAQATAHRNRKAYCVGDATAKAARAAGMAAQSSGGALPDLAADLAQLPRDRQLLQLCGDHVAGDLAGLIGLIGPQITPDVIYRQHAQGLSEAAQALLAGDAPVLLPVFSPRSARLLAPDLEKARAPLCLAAMSHAVARALPVQAACDLVTAPQPDARGMLDALGVLIMQGKFA